MSVNIPSVHVAQVHFCLSLPPVFVRIQTMGQKTNAAGEVGMHLTKRRCPEEARCEAGGHLVDRTDAVYMVWCSRCRRNCCWKCLDDRWLCCDCKLWEFTQDLENLHIEQPRQPRQPRQGVDWENCFTNDPEMKKRSRGLPPASPEPHLCLN